MGAMDPILPEFDIREWRQQPWPTRYRMACQDWVVRGYGSPLPFHDGEAIAGAPALAGRRLGLPI